MSVTETSKQLLHLVFGGELIALEGTSFKVCQEAGYRRNLPELCGGRAAWKAAAQRTVDNALMRYFIVHMHRMMDPDHSHHSRTAAPLTQPNAIVGRMRIFANDGRGSSARLVLRTQDFAASPILTLNREGAAHSIDDDEATR